MKIAWRRILQRWKKGPGRKKATIPKDEFPRLIKELSNELAQNQSKNLKSGFKKCGIVPLDKQKVLNRLPKEKQVEKQSNKAEDEAAVDDAIIEILKDMRYDSAPVVRKRKKINVSPGKSIKGIDFESSEEQDKGTDENGGKRKNGSMKQGIIPLDEQPSCSFQRKSKDLREPSTKKLKSLSNFENNFTEGDFVLFEYEEEIFSGEVTCKR